MLPAAAVHRPAHGHSGRFDLVAAETVTLEDQRVGEVHDPADADAAAPRVLGLVAGQAHHGVHLVAAYAGRPFVRLLDRPPELTHAVGTNYALMHAAASEDGREIQVSVAIDNLIKGAGGQAIQAMNLSLGLSEETGLTAAGVFPC